MDFLAEAKAHFNISCEHFDADRSVWGAERAQLAQTAAIISMAESLAQIAGCVRPNGCEGFPASFNIDGGA